MIHSNLSACSNKMLITKPCSCLLIGILLGLRTSRANSSHRTSLPSLTPSNINITSPAASVPREPGISSRPRRRRFVRFPALPPSYVLEGAGSPPATLQQQAARSLGFANPVRQYPSWRQQKSYWRPPALEYPPARAAPVMSHRTPRLIFRDNEFPVVGGANNFFQSNQLSDVEEDFRGEGS